MQASSALSVHRSARHPICKAKPQQKCPDLRQEMGLVTELFRETMRICLEVASMRCTESLSSADVAQHDRAQHSTAQHTISHAAPVWRCPSAPHALPAIPCQTWTLEALPRTWPQNRWGSHLPGSHCLQNIITAVYPWCSYEIADT